MAAKSEASHGVTNAAENGVVVAVVFGIVHHNMYVIKWKNRTTGDDVTKSHQPQPPLVNPSSSLPRVSHALQPALCRETPESHLQPRRSHPSRRRATISPVFTVISSLQI